jgi:mannose-6-phosphate isomerase
MAEGATDDLRHRTEVPWRRDRRSVAAAPTVLPPNQLERFYQGGDRIWQLRGGSGTGGGSEDWVGSTTTALGTDSEGLSRLPDGRLVRGVIEADPVAFLGTEHVQRWGANPALLVKLLDAGERLPVHFHPGRDFAREALGLGFGKTEAWIIVAAETDAVVYLGLKAEVAPSTMSRWVREQDVPAMLAALHELAVRPGQVLFVPAGTLHAIGAGILMVELQEPTDLSVVLEWKRFGVDGGAEHLHLGWDRVLAAADLTPTPPAELVVCAGTGAQPGAVADLLPARAHPYFRAQRIIVDGAPVHLEPSFAILIVLEGRPTVTSDRAEPLALRSGETALVPFGAGSLTVDGHATMIRCLPPAAGAGPGRW